MAVLPRQGHPWPFMSTMPPDGFEAKSVALFSTRTPGKSRLPALMRLKGAIAVERAQREPDKFWVDELTTIEQV